MYEFDNCRRSLWCVSTVTIVPGCEWTIIGRAFPIHIHICRLNIRLTVNMVSTERVTIRITKEQLLLIQNLIDSGKFDTMTDVVKTALDEFLGKYFSPENIQKVTVDLPRGNMVQLEELVRDGDSISIDDAIRNSVREYTRNRIM